MTIVQTVRQARLKPECATGYPRLPASRWTKAAYMATLVALESADEPGSAKEQYRLSDADFDFRGGFAGDKSGVRTIARSGTPQLPTAPRSD
jgi:hypothetical protein